MNELEQSAQNSANAEKTWPISSAITERIVTYVQMSVKAFLQRVFGLKADCFIMNADYAVVRDLVILNGTVY